MDMAGGSVSDMECWIGFIKVMSVEKGKLLLGRFYPFTIYNNSDGN